MTNGIRSSKPPGNTVMRIVQKYRDGRYFNLFVKGFAVKKAKIAQTSHRTNYISADRVLSPSIRFRTSLIGLRSLNIGSVSNMFLIS